MKKMLLILELVPSTSFFNNVRSAVSRAQWDTIRKRVYSAAYDTCEICGEIGPRHPVECHEIWNYDDKRKIQKLTGMIALCPACHTVKHFGLAQVQNKEKQAIKHFMKVNKLTRTQTDAYLKRAFTIWAERSQYQWTIDISHLKTYGIDVTKLRKNDRL